MDRTLPTYKDAASRVKIGHFAEILGMDITGVIHVGTNYGYEIKWYLAMGIKPEHILGFEPLLSAQKQCQWLYPGVTVHGVALGNKWQMRDFTVYAGDGQGSTLLTEINPDPNTIILDTVQVHEWRFDDFYRLRYGRKASFDYNCLVIDVQGYELQVIEGFGDYLDRIDMISVELSEVPLYGGEAPAHQVIEYLFQRGFTRVTPVERHNDVLFVRATLLNAYYEINSLTRSPQS